MFCPHLALVESPARHPVQTQQLAAPGCSDCSQELGHEKSPEELQPATLQELLLTHSLLRVPHQVLPQ